MTEKKTVVIVEDHTIVREALKKILSKNSSFEVVGEAKDGLEAVAAIACLKPDLVLMDLSLPRMDGIEAVHEIKKENPSTKILVLTVHKTENRIMGALDSGVDGYITKDAAHSELELALRDVFSGRKYLSPMISEKVMKDYPEGGKRSRNPSSSLAKLARRERQILKLIAEGYRNKEIAGLLGISEKTVEKHRSNLMRKLDLHTAQALTAFAISEGLMEKSHSSREVLDFRVCP